MQTAREQEMVQQREGYKFIIIEPAKSWLAEGKCAGCGKPKDEWTRSTRWKCCSTDCTNKYVQDYTYYGWPDLRMKAFKRDKFICVKCGQKPKPMQYEYDISQEKYLWKEIPLEEATEHDYATMLIGDHIHPIALGGDEWSLDNVQTLCKECNKLKTKKDVGKIAKLRIREQFQRAGQKFLEN